MGVGFYLVGEFDLDSQTLYCRGDGHDSNFPQTNPEALNPKPNFRIAEGINSDVALEKGNSVITRNSSGFGGVFTAPGPFFTLLPEDLFPATIEKSSDGDAGGDGEGVGDYEEGESTKELSNVCAAADAVTRTLPPSYLVPKVWLRTRNHQPILNA